MCCATTRFRLGLFDRRRWSSLLSLPLLGASLVFAADADPVTSRGLKPATLDQKLVATAIARSNDILQGSGIRFVATWADKPDKPARNAKAGKAGGKNARNAKGGKAAKDTKDTKDTKDDAAARLGDVPVYLVDAGSNAAAPAAVPQGCRCVFVNPAALASWIDFNTKGESRLPLDRGYFLTFLLLHEAGHLKDGSAAALFEQGAMRPLPDDPGKTMANERHADEFAAGLLQRQSSAKRVENATIQAGWVVIELSTLNWNMQSLHSREDFDAFSAGKPGVAIGDGYTHTNLALRILTTGDLIRHTPGTQQLLQAYQAAYPPAAKPKPADDVRK